MQMILRWVGGIATAAIMLMIPPAPAQVFVDCNIGDSIQKALDAQGEAAVAVVEFVGTCEEFISITRDRVSISGVDDGATIVGRVRMFGPSNVTFRDFTITGPEYGVMVRGGRTRLIGINLVGNVAFDPNYADMDDPNLAADRDFTTREMLSQMGEGASRSIRTYDAKAGKWQTNYWMWGKSNGAEVKVDDVQGYLVDMKDDLKDWYLTE